MFKHTSDKLDDLGRVGSHATKPFGTGRVDVLPPHARQWEAVYASFKEQYSLATEKLERAFVGLRGADTKLTATLPRSEFLATVRVRAGYAEQIKHYQGVCGDLRRCCVQAAANSYGQAFIEAAKLILTNEQYARCSSSAHDMIQGAASRERLQGAVYPPVVTQGTRAENTARLHSYKDALNPESHRAVRLAAKAKKYGRSGALNDRARGPDFKIAHKEF